MCLACFTGKDVYEIPHVTACPWSWLLRTLHLHPALDGSRVAPLGVCPAALRSSLPASCRLFLGTEPGAEQQAEGRHVFSLLNDSEGLHGGAPGHLPPKCVNNLVTPCPRQPWQRGGAGVSCPRGQCEGHGILGRGPKMSFPWRIHEDLGLPAASPQEATFTGPEHLASLYPRADLLKLQTCGKKENSSSSLITHNRN